MRDWGIGATRVITERHTRVVCTWRYLGAPGETVDANTKRFKTPALESPSTGDINDIPPTGESTPPPALLSLAQCDQVRSAAEAYIDTLGNEGRALGEAAASIAPALDTMEEPDRLPPFWLPTATATTAPRRRDAVAATTARF